MKRARLVNGPFHGHTDTIVAAPEWVTVDPACPCCDRAHVIALDPDTADDRPAYRLEHVDAVQARYRYVTDVTDGMAQLLGYEPITTEVDVDELATLSGNAP